MRPRFLVFLILLVFTLACWGQEASAPQGEVLTLEQAVALSLEDNRSMKIADLEVAKSGDQVSATRTKRLPTFDLLSVGSQLLTPVDFRIPAGSLGDFPATGPIPAADTAITTDRKPSAFIMGRVTQPLSQLYRIGLGVRLKELSRDVNREKFRAERQDVINQVKSAYYKLLETQSALTASQQAIRQYRELDRLVGDYVVQQVALKSDSLDVKARLAQEEYRAVALANSLATQKEQLNLLLGRDLRTEFSVSEAPDPGYLEIELSAAQQRALDARPELKQARLNVEQADYDRRMKKAEYIPDVSVALNYVSFTSISVLPRNLTALGLQVSWEPFDWGRKKSELSEKSKALEQARIGLRDTEARVLSDVNYRFRRLAEARAQLRAVQIADESSREKLRVVTNRYGQQSALLSDVLSAQTQASEASHSYQQALLGLWTARADFEKALGEE